MKTFIKYFVLITALVSANGVSAQTTYSINSNTTYSAAGIPTNCKNCTVNIANGVTLTIDKNINLQNVSFVGGASNSTIEVNSNNIVFSGAGSFTNIIANLKNISFSTSAPLTINSSVISLSNNSVATIGASVSLISSTWKINDNSTMEVTGGVFSIQSGSLIIGDGTPASKATAQFNGGSLSILDAVSFVSVVTAKNSYANTNAYNGNGSAITTASVVKGPSSLTAGGVISSATLPVKLESFTAKSNGTTVVLSWITAQEMNLSVFEIERSNDGISWNKISSVSARGNTSTESKYSYSEVVKVASTYSYRLKMVDIDNKSEYSPIVKVAFNTSNNTAIKTYPNPATDFFAVDGGTGAMQVMVVNMNGAVVKMIDGYVANTKISLNGVVAGNYVVKVSNINGSSQSFKMIVAR
jgi:hypothetical protein